MRAFERVQTTVKHANKVNNGDSENDTYAIWSSAICRLSTFLSGEMNIHGIRGDEYTNFTLFSICIALVLFLLHAGYMNNAARPLHLAYAFTLLSIF